MATKEDIIVSQNAKDLVKKEVEKYMSIENFAVTPTISSKLSEEGYLPMTHLLTIPAIQINGITEDELSIVLKDISSLEVSSDNSGVRIKIPVERKTVIIRDTPEDTVEEDIKNVFESVPYLSIRKEVGSSWFITFDSEEKALDAISFLQTKTLKEQPIKARIKAEYYMKVLTKMIQKELTGQKEQPQRKLSSTATPFTLSVEKMEEVNKSLDSLKSSLPEGISDYSAYWNDHATFTQQYEDLYSMQSASNLPFVITSPIKEGYSGEYIKYSPVEILSIVKDVKDTSLPPIATHGDHSIAIVKSANMELVEKGRTMSIDQAFQQGYPRTMSVDSIDYTSMVSGEIEEQTAETLRTYRKRHHPKRNNKPGEKNTQKPKSGKKEEIKK